MMHKTNWIFLFALCALVAMRPVFETKDSKDNMGGFADFPGWPRYLNGQLLEQRELTDYDRYFYRNLPGKLATFETAESELILRWIHQPTRLLHSSSYCFRSQGYEVDHLSLERDRFEKNWHVFRASKEGVILNVRERIFDDHGNSWSDVSAWYWDCLLGRTKGPWWNYVIVEREKERGRAISSGPSSNNRTLVGEMG